MSFGTKIDPLSNRPRPGTLVHGEIPFYWELNRSGLVSAGAPAEAAVGLIDLEMQQAGLEGGLLLSS